MFGGGSRYERRSRARARRVQRRLERANLGRGTRPRPPSLQAQLDPRRAFGSTGARAAIFAGSLCLGALLAEAVTARAVEWLGARPATLESISVLGTERLSGEDVAWATGLEKGSPLGELSEAALESQIAAHPWIREARVAVLPTGTVIVEVEEQVAEAVLRDETGEHFVDASGVEFAQVQPAEALDAAALPLLVGEGADPAILGLGLAIAARIEEIALPDFEEPGLPHRGLELWLPSAARDLRLGWILRRTGGSEVILGNDDVATVHERLDRLARLLESDLMELEETTAIDLRFAGQAVLRKSASR
jgi:cell division septal protein FtsQ